MRLLRLVLISFIVLSLVILFVFALFPRDVRISRYITIQATQQRVAAVVGNLRSWTHWNEFLRNSGLTEFQYSDPSEGQGAYMKGKNLEIQVISSSPDSLITRWIRNDGTHFIFGFRIIPSAANETTVECFFEFHSKWYPWEKLRTMFYDQQLGPPMEKSLVALRTYIGNP